MANETTIPARTHVQLATRRKRSPNSSVVQSKQWNHLGEMKATKVGASAKPVSKPVKSSGGSMRTFTSSRMPAKAVVKNSEESNVTVRMDDLRPKLHEMVNTRRDVRNDLDSQLSQAAHPAAEANVSKISIRDRIITNAQETLMKMIEDEESEIVISNQVDVIERLRAGMKNVKSSTPVAPSSTVGRTRVDKGDQDKRGLGTNGNQAGGHNAGFFIASSPESEPGDYDISSGPEIVCVSDTHISKKRKKTKKSTKKFGKSPDRSFQDATCRAAFPVSKPTSLPHSTRLQKCLSPSQISKQSRVHTSFDETKTNQLDRHTRKINTTNTAAKEKVLAVRTLESRIGLGGLSDSDQDVPQSRRRSSDANREEVDLRVHASIEDLFQDFDVMDEERDLLSDD